ncbi:MAG: 5-(carboxyamino)imidazole ribonucleotide synthase [Acidimicrobiia bacterium]|nr:5-(carboxyamino)imidazole ribonucleotide synthase [Acidimicrobiia bacterium]
MPGHALHPSAIVGVVGGGQLARMTAQAAGPLGIELRVLAGEGDEGAAPVAPTERGDITDADVLLRFASGCDVLTFDHELVPLDVVRRLEGEGVVVRPGSTALELSDKGRLRRRLADRFPLPPHDVVTDASGAIAFGERHGWPVVVKAVRGGYDGRGVNVADGPERATVLMDALAPGVAAVVEPLLDLDFELAVVVVRSPSATATYPVVRTTQVEGICHEVAFPAGVAGHVAEEAVRLATGVADAADAFGAFAVELFVAGGRVLLNEVAPRTHNSGHWTIDGTACSQFENHLRAVLDWPLGPTEAIVPAAGMVNLITGSDGDDPRDLVPAGLAAGDARIHLYDKTPRRGRKVGHVTAVAADVPAAVSRARAVAAAMGSIAAPGDGP